MHLGNTKRDIGGEYNDDKLVRDCVKPLQDRLRDIPDSQTDQDRKRYYFQEDKRDTYRSHFDAVDKRKPYKEEGDDGRRIVKKTFSFCQYLQRVWEFELRKDRTYTDCVSSQDHSKKAHQHSYRKRVLGKDCKVKGYPDKYRQDNRDKTQVKDSDTVTLEIIQFKVDRIRKKN